MQDTILFGLVVYSIFEFVMRRYWESAWLQRNDELDSRMTSLSSQFERCICGVQDRENTREGDAL